MRSSLAKLPFSLPASAKDRQDSSDKPEHPSDPKRLRAPRNTSPRDGFVFASNPTSAAANRYRKMCAEIVSETWARKLMLVTSPSAGDGKTITAVNLAFALAERENSVLLLELALERPRFRYVFGEPPSGKGVEALLRGTAEPADVIGELGDSGIAIAGVNVPSEENSLLNDNPHLDRLLEYSEKHYDWTIIDAPDVFACSAVERLARVIEPVVMVVRSHQTHLDSFRSAVGTLHERINFVIMNDEQR